MTDVRRHMTRSWAFAFLCGAILFNLLGRQPGVPAEFATVPPAVEAFLELDGPADHESEVPAPIIVLTAPRGPSDQLMALSHADCLADGPFAPFAPRPPPSCSR
jgi:hypothetical protein